MIQPDDWFSVDPSSTRLSDDIDRAATVFARHRAILCRDVFDAAMLVRLARICAAATFIDNRVDGLGYRRIEQPAIAGNAIQLLLRRAPLFRWIEAVTGRARIGTIEGRVVETHAEPDHQLRWHDDVEPGRLLAITIGLGDIPYEGGDFESRVVATHAPLVRLRHDRPGAALIFDVAADCEHRVLPVTGGGPRRVFAGWFTV